MKNERELWVSAGEHNDEVTDGQDANLTLAHGGGIEDAEASTTRDDVTDNPAAVQIQVDTRRQYYAGACQGAADMLSQWLAMHGDARRNQAAVGDLHYVQQLRGLATGYAFAAAQLLDNLDDPQPYARAIRSIRNEAERMEVRAADPKYADDERHEATGCRLALKCVLEAIESDDDLMFPAKLFPHPDVNGGTTQLTTTK